jgi:hypothetical protein
MSRPAPCALPLARLVAAGLGLLGVACAHRDRAAPSATPTTVTTTTAPAAPAPAPAAEPARLLFDGRALAPWRATGFGGDGEVRVANGELQLAEGDPMTGVTWAGAPLPTVDYEIALEAQRRSGGDFFCGLTFPVGDAALSLIVGGWGGTVVGLSSLDGEDASENETTRSMTFETGRWYRVRVRVTSGRVTAWIDDERVVDARTTGRTLSVRAEVEGSRPLGIATWNTGAALRTITLRRLVPGR